MSTSADRNWAVQTSFRVGITCSSISAVLVTFFEWLGNHPFQSLRDQPVTIVYGQQHWLSLPVVLCLTSIVVLGVVQVTLIWRTPLARDWWAPLVVEVGLCVAFAVAYHQVFGNFGFSCGQTLASCSPLRPRLIQGSGWHVFAILGVALGLAWSLVDRQDRSLSPS